MKLIDEALQFIEERPEIYNPGFPIKVRNSVISASSLNSYPRVILAGSKKCGSVHVRHEVKLTDFSDTMFKSFIKQDKGTQTDFLGAIMLVAYQRHYKLISSCFFTRNSKMSYPILAQRLLDTDVYMTPFFINSEKLFPSFTDRDFVTSQDLSPVNCARVLKELLNG